MSARAKCPHCGGDHRIPEMDMASDAPADAMAGPALREPDDAAVKCPHCGGTYRVSVAVFGQAAAPDDSGDLLRVEQWRGVSGDGVSVRHLPSSAFTGHIAPLVVAGAVVHVVFALTHSALEQAIGIETAAEGLPGALWGGVVMCLVCLLVVCLLPPILNRRGSGGSGLRIALGRDATCPPGLRTVVRVDLMSAAKVGTVCGAIVGFAVLCVFGVRLASGGAIPEPLGGRVLVLLTPVFGSIEGGAIGLLSGALYSALASAWGGVAFGVAAPGLTGREGRYEAEVRDVDPGDLGVVLAGVGLILGLAWAVIATIAGAASLSASTDEVLQDSVGGLMALGPFALIGLPIVGFVVGAIVAAVYSVSARIVGGLAIEIR